jgi:hypothetical protein
MIQWTSVTLARFRVNNFLVLDGKLFCLLLNFGQAAEVICIVSVSRIVQRKSLFLLHGDL